MRDFSCPICGARLAFENSVCLACSADVGFDIDEMAFQTVDPQSGRQMCANLGLAACNWLAAVDHPDGLCASCRLTRTRPALEDVDTGVAFAEAEAAKRRLVVQLVELDLPYVGRETDPETGLCFDLLSSAREAVTTGHDNGVITLDLAESNDAHREHLRLSMGEPYRTLLGHFRHEIGHYFFGVLVAGDESRRQFTDLFGDPDASYADALDRHYSQGPPVGWEQDHVSSYATMHAAEDWAETFAHYLHIRDTCDTAAAFGFTSVPSAQQVDVPGGFDRILERWVPLTWTLNMLNRSMGHHDLYPFVLPIPVIAKLRWVHELVAGSTP